MLITMIILGLWPSVTLEQMPVNSAHRFVVKSDGFYTIFNTEFWHHDFQGSLIYHHSGKKMVLAAQEIDGSYIISFWDCGYSVQIVDSSGVIEHESGAKVFGIMQVRDSLLVTSNEFRPGKRLLQSCEVAVDGLKPKREPYFEPNIVDRSFKGIWIVPSGDDDLIMTQLENVVYRYRLNQQLSKISLVTDFQPYPGRIGDRKAAEWLSSFTRVVGFGALKDGFVVAYERSGYTELVILDSHLAPTGQVNISAYRTKGLLLYGGTDGSQAYALEPSRSTVRTVID